MNGSMNWTVNLRVREIGRGTNCTGTTLGEPIEVDESIWIPVLYDRERAPVMVLTDNLTICRDERSCDVCYWRLSKMLTEFKIRATGEAIGSDTNQLVVIEAVCGKCRNHRLFEPALVMPEGDE